MFYHEIIKMHDLVTVETPSPILARSGVRKYVATHIWVARPFTLGPEIIKI